MGVILKTENGTYTYNCLLDNSVPFIECSLVIDDEFRTAEVTDGIDERKCVGNPR